MKRLLFVHRSPDFTKAVAERMRGAYLIRCLFDGQQALEALEEFRPHGLLLHTALPRKDGLTVLEQMSHRPEVIVATTDYLDPFLTCRAHRLGVSELLLMPMVSTAAAAMTRLLEQGQDSFSLPVWLQSLGLRPGLTGYRLLLQAVECLKKDPGQSLSGDIYPCLGAPQGVEKAIRTAIHTAWREGEGQVWRKYFPQNRCPGNKTFLSVALQLYRDEASNDYGVFRNGAVHSQNLHAGIRGLPEGSAEVWVGSVVGMEQPHISHLNDEQHIGAVPLPCQVRQLPQMPGTPEGGRVGEGAHPIILQSHPFDL